MLTIKWHDQDGTEYIDEAVDVRARKNQHGTVTALSWKEPNHDAGMTLAFDTTAYVMNDTGATIAKYVVYGPLDDPAPKA